MLIQIINDYLATVGGIFIFLAVGIIIFVINGGIR